jgi:hypothetical protein
LVPAIACNPTTSTSAKPEVDAALPAPSAAASADVPRDVCPIGELRLLASPGPGTPATLGLPNDTVLFTLRANGDVESGFPEEGPSYRIHPEGCVTFDGKLVVELMPDGTLLTETGEEMGRRRGNTLGFRHAEMEIVMPGGAVVMRPELPVVRWRFDGLDPGEECAAAMLIVTSHRSMSGASMAVVDGVAKRPPVAAALPSSRCKHLPRE